MEQKRIEKTERLTVSIDESNFVLLKWLKINYQDSFSSVVNSLLTKYRNEVTQGMTPYELEQIEQLRFVGDRGAIDVKKIGNLRATLLMGKVDDTLKDKAKRAALKDLIELYDND